MTMSKLDNLADIVFVDADADEVESYVIGRYEAITGRTLAKGDPVRLFLLTIAALIVLLLNKINETGKQNLLRYATGDNLDHLGALVGVERIPAKAAVTTMRIRLSAKLQTATIIPAGTRFTAGDNVFFALDAPLVIDAGATSADGSATCLTKGELGNGYVAGQLKTLVDPVPYVDSVANITTSEGGAEVQSDDSYREDIRRAPENFSTAGPEGAYIYHAKRASTKIADVTVWSPEAGKVEVRPLLAAGVTATGADGKPVIGLLPKVTIDTELPLSSTNPVQNKTITAALSNLDIDIATNDEIDNALNLAGSGDLPTGGGVSSGSNYTLPTASSSTLGGVKIGSNISAPDGTISLAKSNVTSALGYTPATTNNASFTGTTMVQTLTVSSALNIPGGSIWIE